MSTFPRALFHERFSMSTFPFSFWGGSGGAADKVPLSIEPLLVAPATPVTPVTLVTPVTPVNSRNPRYPRDSRDTRYTPVTPVTKP